MRSEKCPRAALSKPRSGRSRSACPTAQFPARKRLRRRPLGEERCRASIRLRHHRPSLPWIAMASPGCGEVGNGSYRVGQGRTLKCDVDPLLPFAKLA